MATSDGNEAASQATGIPDPFESRYSFVIQSLDQYDMQEQMSAMGQDVNVRVILKDSKTVELEGCWVNVEKAIEQLKDLRSKQIAGKNTMEENKEQPSDKDDAAARPGRNRVLRKDLTPSNKQVDLSQAEKVPIEQDVWYYLERKHPNKVNKIATKHLCISRVVCEPSTEGITHCLEIVPFYREDSDEAKKHVEDAVEEFAHFYQKVSMPGIVREGISELPPPLDKGIPQQLISELEEVGVFILRSDNTCLVGTNDCIEEAKQKLSDFIRRQKESPARTQPNDDLGLAQASAADRFEPMTFKTPNGLTVHVSKGDLVSQSLDAIVNPANENLGNGGGAARSIAKAAGYDLERDCKEFISKFGKLGIAHVMHTSAGNLRPNIRFVIHTVGPRKSEEKDDNVLFGLVKSAIFNCLLHANDSLEIRSIAIPAISSGIFGVSIEIVGKASFEALKLFDNYYASSKKKSLHEIHFLNNDAPTVDNMKRIFQSLMKDFKESSVDPEQSVNLMELFGKYANVCGRQIIKTTPHDSCFTRALATALKRDFQSKLDWHKVEDVIKKELDNNKDYYKLFRTSDESGKQWSFADVVKNPGDAFANFFSPTNESKSCHPDVWISAAASAFKVLIVLVQLSEKQVPVERNFKPRLSEGDKTVYIAYYYCGHHHFDALVKETSLEEIASLKKVSKSVDDGPAGIKKDGSSSHNGNNGLSHTRSIENSFELVSKDEASDMSIENASEVAGKQAAKANDDKKNDDKKDDDDNHCIICMDDITDKKELSCKHKFCRGCIDEYFSKCQPKCPSCGKVFGTLRGDQPKGTMQWNENSWQHLPGYNDCGTIEIQYYFPDGNQGENHPNPGQSYRGTHRTAYLPANKEGKEVLHLLRRAFDADLVFTIGRSNTTGRENVVIWNDVHHKTSPNGQYGYPDPTYLKRVKEELAAKGIQ